MEMISLATQDADISEYIYMDKEELRITLDAVNTNIEQFEIQLQEARKQRIIVQGMMNILDDLS